MWLLHYVIATLVRNVSRLIFPIQRNNSVPDLPKDCPIIVASSHHSAIDPFVFMSIMPLTRNLFLPLYFIVKYEYFQTSTPRWLFIPIAFIGRQLFRVVGCIPVKRGTGAHLGKTLQSVIDKLKKNRMVFFFVEGSRSDDEFIQTVKPGACYAGLVSGAYILPSVVMGTGQKNTRRNHYAIHFGEPFLLPRIDNPTPQDMALAAEQIRLAIIEAQIRHRNT